MLYILCAAIYLINHLAVTVVRANNRFRNYGYRYGGNTTWVRCIRRRVFKIRTIIFAVLITFSEVILLINFIPKLFR